MNHLIIAVILGILALVAPTAFAQEPKIGSFPPDVEEMDAPSHPNKVEVYSTPLGKVKVVRGVERSGNTFALVFLNHHPLTDVLGPQLRSVVTVGRRVFLILSYGVYEIQGKKLELHLDVDMIHRCEGSICTLLPEGGAGVFTGVVFFDTHTNQWVEVKYVGPARFEANSIKRLKTKGKQHYLLTHANDRTGALPPQTVFDKSRGVLIPLQPYEPR